MSNPTALAQEISQAYAQRQIIPAPSTRDGGLDLDTAYAVEGEIIFSTPVGVFRRPYRHTGRYAAFPALF